MENANTLNISNLRKREKIKLQADAAYETYLNNSNKSLREIAKEHNINYHTLYLHVKTKNKSFGNSSNVSKAKGGRKPKYTYEQLVNAILDCTRGKNIEHVAIKHNINVSTLKTYVSLNRTKNENVKTLNKKIDISKPTKPKFKVKIEKGISNYLYYAKYKFMSVLQLTDKDEDEIEETHIDYIIKDGAFVYISLSFLVHLIGNQGNIVSTLHNETSKMSPPLLQNGNPCPVNYYTVEHGDDIYKPENREKISLSYFSLSSVLENLRKIEIPKTIYNVIKEVYLVLKDAQSQMLNVKGL